MKLDSQLQLQMTKQGKGNINLFLFFIFLFLHIAHCEAQSVDIIKYWSADTQTNYANLEISRTLFVSSWNSKGRKYAIEFAYKFQSIILCLYDLRFQDRQFYLQKLIEIQPSFLKQLKRANPKIKLILRIYVSSSSKSIFQYVSSSTKKISDLAIAIAKVMRKEKASGIFYDSLYNLPVTINAAQTYGPYDKFAILLNSYILNRLRDQFKQKQKLIYGIKISEYRLEDIDFPTLRQLKAHAFMIQSLDSNRADVSMNKALSFIKQMRSNDKNIELYMVLPLFSWRNGIGMKTPTIKSYLFKNGIGFRSFKHGLCCYIEKIGRAEDCVPCNHYYEVAKQYAVENNFKLAYFQAGDAIDNQFSII